ncbi:ABC transporter permease [Foetidibacter luteolus]|uniref:ABC transporter permease n=1 Tax=Foetidibacter luteolus TaxID=2608880 RepID=UPI00129B53A3|nr:ABC transporter permease [Foetidibacter luteolus]
MLKHYLKTAWRNLVKNKAYTIVNIAGLSAGLTCFTLIALWVTDELSFDTFNSNYSRIVRLTGVEKTQTGIKESAVTGAQMAKALKDDYAEVENTVRVDMHGDEIILLNNQQVLQHNILLADPSLFTVFDYKLSNGNETTALAEPYSLVLTQSAVKQYFGNEDPMGKSLVIFMMDSAGQGANYKITGIMPDPPLNAHFTFTMIASFKTIEAAHPEVMTVEGWADASPSYYTYLLLKKGIDVNSFSKKIEFFYKKYVGDKFATWKNTIAYKLQLLGDIHLHSHLQNEITSNGSIAQVYIFSTIGIIILLLAGINYTNLSTARSAARAKEVGIKKVAGLSKRQLIFQYLSEAILTVLMALVFSILFAYLLQPFFWEVTGKNVAVFNSPSLLAFLVCVTVFLGLLSGLYPAVVLSGFKPAIVLKGSFKSGEKGVLLRKTLVVSQFVITIILITGIVVIYMQMAYIQNMDLGYNKNALLYLRVNGNANVIRGYQSFRDELKGSPLINGVATSNSSLAGGLDVGSAETIDDKGNPLQVNTARLGMDEYCLDVYGIELLAGRNFSSSASNNQVRPVILNEMAVKKFGWKDAGAAIGKPFTSGEVPGMVVGVTRNFHFNSLQHTIEPLAIYPLANHFSRVNINADMAQVKQTLTFIENTWKKHFPSVLFDYEFMSEQVKRQYQSQERFSTVFLYFSVLSLLIACLGLSGLISYTIFQKTKEIGIHKVLGANVSGIVALLSKDFLRLVLLACFISLPVAWYIMNKWLQDFAYRVTLSWWMFAAAGFLVLLVAVLTVSIQSIKAATENPMKSLRAE